MWRKGLLRAAAALLTATVLGGTATSSVGLRRVRSEVVVAALAAGGTGSTGSSPGAPDLRTDPIDERAERVALRRAGRSDRAPGRVRPASGHLTGWFGERRGGHRHPGIDIDGDTGDPVVAAAAGIVSQAGPAPSGYSGYGLIVLIDHGDGRQTLYAHLSRLAVAAGDRVVAGDLVGAIGTTGNVTGSHLHFELREGGRPVNPAAWLAAR